MWAVRICGQALPRVAMNEKGMDTPDPHVILGERIEKTAGF